MERSPESFQLLEKLGEGGMGQVYKAIDSSSDQVVALKFLIAGADEGMQRRLRLEAREQAALNHPNVVKLYEHMSYEGHDFLVMEYMDRGNLKDFVNGAPELMKALVNSDEAHACYARNWTEYALGRPVAKGEQGWVKQLGATSRKGTSAADLLIDLASSDLVRARPASSEETAP